MKYLFILMLNFTYLLGQVTAYEASLINKLIHDMATRSTPYLIFHLKAYKQLRKKLRHLSPIAFFTHILESHERKRNLQIILKGYFTRTELVDEATDIFNKYDQNKLYEEIVEFSQLFEKDQQTLMYHAQRRNWEQFISYIAQ